MSGIWSSTRSCSRCLSRRSCSDSRASERASELQIHEIHNCLANLLLLLLPPLLSVSMTAQRERERVAKQVERERESASAAQAARVCVRATRIQAQLRSQRKSCERVARYSSRQAKRDEASVAERARALTNTLTMQRESARAAVCVRSISPAQRQRCSRATISAATTCKEAERDRASERAQEAA